LHLLIEWLMEHCAHRYQSIGLTFYTPDTLANTTVFHCLQEAVGILTSVPTLHRTIAQLVRVCHLVKPEDDDYDVSYSDPHVPFSICISVPLERQANDALRVAEALVHEAMHLQLTLIELVTALVQPSEKRYFSPWKGAYREPQGVLHALYVFRVIDQCFEQLLALPEWSSGSIGHMHQRRCDIASQVREIEVFKNSHALTALGARFVQKLMGD
jgi:HEXXH motif-containing protein